LAVSLVTGFAANADASTEFSAERAPVSESTGHVAPQWQTARCALVAGAAAASELLSGPIASAIVGIAFGFALGDVAPTTVASDAARKNDAAFVKAANASLDSGEATAS
jgi:hypothetical protein